MNHARSIPAVYVKTWLALLFLSAVTIVGAHLNLGKFGLPLTLLIAVSQAVIILLFFMNLRARKAGIIVVVACAAWLWLGILIVGTLHDYLTRNWLPS